MTADSATAHAPPHSIEAEQSTLGGLLLDSRNAWPEIAEILNVDDFYRPDHRLIFEAIGILAGSGKPCDVVTVSEQLERTGKLEAVGGLAYLSSLARDTPTAANVRAYAELVRARALLRGGIEFGRSIESRVANGATAADLVITFESELSQMRRGLTTQPKRSAIAWNSLEGREPPPREWVIPYWIPAGHTTLLAGRGGVGKTLLAQHVAAALALGHEYIELLEPRRVLMWGGEDDEAEFWRRQVQISSWMGKPLSALSERFYLRSYAGDDITLLAPIYGALTATPRLTELRQQVGDYRAEVVILDNIARLYGGSENDRHAVTTFCALVQGACAPAAVILLGHPSKASGSEYSGSTAWEGAVRARLYLSDRPPDQDADDDAPVDESIRYISRRKANYSARDIRKLRLQDGVLIPCAVDPVKAGDGGSPTGEFLKDIVRAAVRRLAERGIYGSASSRAGNYLPKLAKQYSLLDITTEKAFAGAMREMIMAGTLIEREVGKYANRTLKVGLVLP